MQRLLRQALGQGSALSPEVTAAAAFSGWLGSGQGLRRAQEAGGSHSSGSGRQSAHPASGLRGKETWRLGLSSRLCPNLLDNGLQCCPSPSGLSFPVVLRGGRWGSKGGDD